MKANSLIIILSFILFISCEDPVGDPVFNGFTFTFSNNLYPINDATLYIGGYKNGNFIKTDSITFLEIEKGNIHTTGSHFAEENRWKPNLEKIRILSNDSCYFKLKYKFVNIREEILGRYNSAENFTLDISDGKDFFIGNKGLIFITIKDNTITGRAAEE
jgi:hypothetical protein